MSLQRARLTALLAEQALTSVELVIAPPGYGKTTVLRDYASGDPGAVFVALPEAADLEMFVRAVVAAAEPSAARSVGAVFDGRSGRELEDHAGQWLVSRLRAFNGTLIVDDFHRTAGDERVARIVAATIAATVGRMRWLVASREAPHFPMGSWIARGWMGLPVSGDDLRFNAEEGSALAASLGITITSAEVDDIIRDTVGWPIGVRLALSLVARQRGAQQTRMQTRDALFALLEDEIWRGLELELRELIAAAALMPAPTISTLTSAGFTNARSAMTQVFERIPFVQQIDDDAFSIHDLFRDFVANRPPEPETASAVALRIGSALVADSNPADGLRLLISAGDTEAVRGALATHAFDLLETGHRALVGTALVYFAERKLDDDGVILAIRGAIAYADGSATNAANLYARALDRGLPPNLRAEVSRRLALNYVNRNMQTEALDVLAPLGSDATLAADDRLEIQALSTAIVATSGKRAPGEILELIERLEKNLSLATPQIQVSMLQRLASAAFYAGDLNTSERLALDAAALARELGMDTATAVAYMSLYAVAGFADSNTARAGTFLRAQAAAAERAGNLPLQIYALRSQYIFAAIEGNNAEAARLDAALSEQPDARTHRQSFAFRRARALLYVVNGEFSKAEATIQSLSVKSLSAAERAHRDTFITVLFLAQGNRDAAAAATVRGLVIDAAHDLWNRTESARAYAFRGLALWALDRPAQARKAFGFDADGLPQRDRILVGALKELCEQPHPLPRSDSVAAIYQTLDEAGFSSYGALIRAVVDRDANDVQLSATEIEILREFDRFGGRAADVAKALGKSKYTVQNQVQSAIRKLGCSGRAEALAYARRRGWLDHG
jgi:ATP/maltotriose-dependent transcriptional regulator MalT/DNA-binding CsgD family transcriptional regulator